MSLRTQVSEAVMKLVELLQDVGRDAKRRRTRCASKQHDRGEEAKELNMQLRIGTSNALRGALAALQVGHTKLRF